MNILNEIAEKTAERIAREKWQRPLEQVRREAEELLQWQTACEARETLRKQAGSEGGEAQTDLLPVFAFERALAEDGISFICEVKKASPSKGLIAAEFPYLDIARDYERAGASAISCLTEPFYFQGQDRYLQEIAQTVRIPVLRKDFTVDEYMVYQAKALGAGAVLLICAILDDARLRAYGQLARELGLSALVEAHSEEEVERALRAGARIVGVNNRDLRTFEVDLDNSLRLRKLVPPEVLFVSESGIRTAQDIRRLRENGTDAVLIGETLMRSGEKGALLREWKTV